MIDLAWARREMELRETEELLDILVSRDEEEWQPGVFPIIEEVLRERGVSVDEAVAARRQEASPRLAIEAPPSAPPVAVAEFEDEVEAGVCRMTLAGAGIDARLEPSPQSNVLVLLVDAAQAEAAKTALAAAEAEAGDEPGFRCASCGFIADPLREGGRLVCQVCGEAG